MNALQLGEWELEEFVTFCTDYVQRRRMNPKTCFKGREAASGIARSGKIWGTLLKKQKQNKANIYLAEEKNIPLFLPVVSLLKCPFVATMVLLIKHKTDLVEAILSKIKDKVNDGKTGNKR